MKSLFDFRVIMSDNYLICYCIVTLIALLFIIYLMQQHRMAPLKTLFIKNQKITQKYTLCK